MMRQSNNRLFYVIFSILIVISCYVIDYYFLIPKYKLVRDDLSSTEAQVMAVVEKKSSLDKSKETLDSIGSLLDQVLVAIPNDKDAPNTIAEIEAIARKNNSFVPSIQVKDSSDISTTSDPLSAVSGSGNKIDIYFAVSGNFVDLNNLISDIENDLKFFEVKSFGFTSSGAGTSTSLSLQLTGYKQSQSYSLISSAGSLPDSQN